MGFKKLPSIEILKANYPNEVGIEPIINLIGGRVADNLRDPNQPNYKNTCAIRVSRALNYSGHPIDRNVLASDRTNSGSDKKWYVFGVFDLRKYLNYVYGTSKNEPDLVKAGKNNGDITEKDFEGEYGIIEFDNYHIDLWLGTTCYHQCYFGSVSTVRLWRAPGPALEVTPAPTVPTPSPVEIDSVGGGAGGGGGSSW